MYFDILIQKFIFKKTLLKPYLYLCNLYNYFYKLPKRFFDKKRGKKLSKYWNKYIAIINKRFFY